MPQARPLTRNFLLESLANYLDLISANQNPGVTQQYMVSLGIVYVLQYKADVISIGESDRLLVFLSHSLFLSILSLHSRVLVGERSHSRRY